MALRKHKHTQVPIWIKLPHLPIEFWTNEGLSTVASGIGRPLYHDAITNACTRLDFARVCIMLDISSNLPKHIVIMVPKDDGREALYRMDVEYEWVPLKCRTCNSLGHQTVKCPSTQPSAKSPISVYVQCRKRETNDSRDVGVMKPELPMHAEPTPTPEPIVPMEQVSERQIPPILVGNGERKGKELVLYNHFDILMDEIDLAECSTRGPNTCSPKDGVP